MRMCQGSAQPTAQRLGLDAGYTASRFGVGCDGHGAAQPMPNKRR